MRPIADDWSWQQGAGCRDADPSLFFHPDGERGARRKRREKMAKVICSECPVIRECQAHALRFGEDFGTWGGLSEDDRGVSRQARRREPTPNRHIVTSDLDGTVHRIPSAPSIFV